MLRRLAMIEMAKLVEIHRNNRMLIVPVPALARILLAQRLDRLKEGIHDSRTIDGALDHHGVFCHVLRNVRKGIDAVALVDDAPDDNRCPQELIDALLERRCFSEKKTAGN